MASHNHPTCEICHRQDAVVAIGFWIYNAAGVIEFEMRTNLCQNCASLVKSDVVGVLQGECVPSSKARRLRDEQP
jgi:hypothetical protein